MAAIWDYADFDDHESVHFFCDAATGLSAIIAIHSTVLGPAAGGTRYWTYANNSEAMTDALRLSRGMSYKNTLAGLPMGGGKGVILAGADNTKTPELLAAYGRAIESLGGRYVTAEDVGMTDADMMAIATATRHVSGLPVKEGSAGGDPGPSTALGVFLGVQAVSAHALDKGDLNGVHVAVQGVGSVGGALARRLAEAGARLTLADVDFQRADALARELGGRAVPAEDILRAEADILSPCALGAILDEQSIPALRVKAVAGGANNQLATIEDGQRLHDRGIVYAPDYVINAGGIINVALEYLAEGDRDEVENRVRQIPGRLHQIWEESEAKRVPPAAIADAMARRLIGR